MPTYRVTDPTTGKTLKLTGDSPPTEAELEEIFKSAGGSSTTLAPEAPIAPEATDPTFMDQARGAKDKWARMLSNIAPSAINATRDFIVQPALHPLQTLESMGQIPIGLFNKLAPEGMQIPGQGEAEGAVNALGGRLSSRYGSLSKIDETLASDPVGAAAELSMLVGGAKGVASGVKKGVGKVAEMVPGPVAGKVDAWSQSLYRKAISPPTRKSLSEAQIEEGIKTGLNDRKFVPNKKNLTALSADIDTINGKISNWFKETGEAPQLIPIDKVLARLKGLREEFVHDSKALGQITQVENMLRKPNKDFAGKLVDKNGQQFIPSNVAHDMKRALYKQLGNRPYGVVDTLPEATLAKRALAAALKEEVALAHKDLASLNAADSKLIRLQEIAEPRIRREMNNQWWSLSGKAAMALGHGVAGKWGMVAGKVLDSLNRSPSIQSRTAILMNKFAKAGVKADEAVVREILAQMPEKIEFPDIAKMDEMLAARAAEPSRAAAEQAAWRAEKAKSEATRSEMDAANRRGVAGIARAKDPALGTEQVMREQAAREQAAWAAAKEDPAVNVLNRATTDATNRGELADIARQKDALIQRLDTSPKISFTELQGMYKKVFGKAPDPFLGPVRIKELIYEGLTEEKPIGLSGHTSSRVPIKTKSDKWVETVFPERVGPEGRPLNTAIDLKQKFKDSPIVKMRGGGPSTEELVTLARSVGKKVNSMTTGDVARLMDDLASSQKRLIFPSGMSEKQRSAITQSIQQMAAEAGFRSDWAAARNQQLVGELPHWGSGYRMNAPMR